MCKVDMFVMSCMAVKCCLISWVAAIPWPSVTIYAAAETEGRLPLEGVRSVTFGCYSK